MDAIKEKYKTLIHIVTELDEVPHTAYKKEEQLQSDLEAKPILVMTLKKQVDEKMQPLVDLEVTPSLSPEEVNKLKEHERDVLKLQSSLNLNNWMNSI